MKTLLQILDLTNEPNIIEENFKKEDKKKTTMNAQQFCAEFAEETASGRITFPKRIVDKFIKTYTNLEPEDFTKEMRKRLVTFAMIDLYDQGINYHIAEKELPEEKITIPDSVFK